MLTTAPRRMVAQTYGSPRVHLKLQAQGIKCSRKRVARLMQQKQLRACIARRFVMTFVMMTDSQHSWPVADNVLSHQSEVEDIAEINRTWAGDISHVPTAQG
jgi:putative transposase